MNVLEYLDIKTIKATTAETIVELKITDNVKQPYGIVHGGVNALLAETAASIAANVDLDHTSQVAVGVDVHSHHLKAVSHGTIQAIATPIKRGRRLQTWQVTTLEIESGQETSFSTITTMINQL
ncbi:PaaI family thioesterase [Weissella soli]|jgi:uncharacterized protein (TIGR00369 family)|uniref:Uncharacterized protein (TIGR00369 family) n=1 Tax=Weissella soli TaxID=155866 RepID=A0A288QA36_9LACO|nr:PaaI family thioesterase [Weissella soli]AOT57204.1 1,4-dihydroxy-2-naphthoyl-CoA hydrolase [Weissella soli]MCT8394288.1 PaaI family thioesterase [Weissella soli]NKY83778.1 PaaI family thioesterase [Weissella soli]QEA35406.1 PaaI family thioesterase [Weissella soli]RDL06675.1 uncharacterized protein (TIGR00369 family) [Weissella soli]